MTWKLEQIGLRGFGGGLLLAGVLLFGAMTLPAQPAAQNETQERLLARRAAIVDAQRQLLEIINGVEIDAETTVRDFIAESDEIRSSVDGVIRGAEVIETRYLHDGSCEVDLELPVRRLTRVLRKNFVYPDETLIATGVGIMRTGDDGAAAAVPASEVKDDTWYAQTVSASGTGIAPQGKSGTAQGRLLAQRAAQVDAQRNLMEKVMGVRIEAQTTVRDFVAESDAVRSKMKGYMRGARRIASRDLPDGAVEVDVEIDLRGVRKIIFLEHKRYAEIVR